MSISRSPRESSRRFAVACSGGRPMVTSGGRNAPLNASVWNPPFAHEAGLRRAEKDSRPLFSDLPIRDSHPPLHPLGQLLAMRNNHEHRVLLGLKFEE